MKNILLGAVLGISLLSVSISLNSSEKDEPNQIQDDLASKNFESKIDCSNLNSKSLKILGELISKYGATHKYEKIEIFYSSELDTCLMVYKRYNLAKINLDGSTDVPTTSWRVYDLLNNKELFDSFASPQNYFEEIPEEINRGIEQFKGNDISKINELIENSPLIVVNE